MGAIKSGYIEPVQNRSLADACIGALVAQSALGFRAQAPSSEPLRDIVNALGSVRPEQSDLAVASCIRGMVAGLNSYSQYLDRVDFRELQVGSPLVGGIGLELAPDAEGARIVDAIEGGPGESAGFLRGDLIASVDGVDLRGRSLADIIRLLRGEPGSVVTLIVRRPGRTEPLHFSVKRAIIRVQSVRGRLLDSGIAYLATPGFYESTPERLAQTIADLRRKNQGALTGLILDLRRCSGGLLNASVAVAAAFLPRGTLVADLRGRSPDSSRRYTSAPEDYSRGRDPDPLADLPPETRSAPMVVLIGPVTAAGAEMVASALKDGKRAAVIGTRSRGKGTVETVVPLTGGTALKLTTARIYRPNGESLDGKGVEPDEIVEAPSRTDDGIPPATSLPRGAELGSLADPAVAKAVAIVRSGRRP
jgi:carboxyl-terminal processing protease